MTYSNILTACGFSENEIKGGTLAVTTPVDGSEIAVVREHSAAEAEAMISSASQAFKKWRLVPAPRRGELVSVVRVDAMIVFSLESLCFSSCA
ncbi:MAG: hypothetical protein COA78_31730 [Blastopirellula sp.]|nr:MAG: hypothetical protein COA78_31730 [Blastopirellula sp.]